jgi:hypothetical protein
VFPKKLYELLKAVILEHILILIIILEHQGFGKNGFSWDLLVCSFHFDLCGHVGWGSSCSWAASSVVCAAFGCTRVNSALLTAALALH